MHIYLTNKYDHGKWGNFACQGLDKVWHLNTQVKNGEGCLFIFRSRLCFLQIRIPPKFYEFSHTSVLNIVAIHMYNNIPYYCFEKIKNNRYYNLMSIDLVDVDIIQSIDHLWNLIHRAIVDVIIFVTMSTWIFYRTDKLIYDKK